MADDFILQTFRYRLSPEVLAQTTAFVLPFVWHQDLSDFMEDVYGPGRGGVPYERLNTVLTALIPGQIHPFAWVAGQRRMVTLRPAAERPTAAQIYTVIRIWAALACAIRG